MTSMRSLFGVRFSLGIMILLLLAVAWQLPAQAQPNKQAKTIKLINRLLDVMEKDIVPLTRKGVVKGNKTFGAAILLKSDQSLVIAATNNERENPLWHGEVHVIKKLYELPETKRPNPKDCIFFATHEPCPLCLSAITWAGYDNFYYLFSHEDTRDSFGIPHDLKMLKEVFKQDPGGYARINAYWKSTGLIRMINALEDGKEKNRLRARVARLREIYAELDRTYQKAKGKWVPPIESK